MTDAQLDSPLEVTETAMPADDANTDDGLVFDNPQMVDIAMSEFFGYKPGDAIESADRDYMQTIWNYYAEGAKSSGEILRKISQAERAIEPPAFGESRLGKFYTYVRLLEEEKSVHSEISAYKK